ncbi:protein-glutamate O-methyltransferase CheR [Rossellomorea aquimaris]|nr:protein-glutamate O-methyltransferase CheR [Rossellomorea aquimaris]
MDDYELFISKFKKKSGLDLALYKEAQMKRRLIAFLEKKGFLSFSDLFKRMEKDEELYDEFLDRITINVSEFYRNYERWKVLEESILPQLLNENKELKVWSAACSTGEEPYTLAMILSNFFPLDQISVLASDIDQNVISNAKVGLYPERDLAEVPEMMKTKYFVQEGNFFKLKDSIKKTVTFKKQNLLSDTFDSHFDLIVCRNVMIYFTDQAKSELYKKFSKALKPGGILFVGSTEQIFAPQQYGFEAAATFFYRKMTDKEGG